MNLLLFSSGHQLAWVFCSGLFTASGHSNPLFYHRGKPSKLPFLIPLDPCAPLPPAWSGKRESGGCGGVTSAAGDCGLWTLRGFQRLQLLHSCRKNPLRKGHCAGELVGGSASRMDAGATPAKRREEGPRATNIKGQGSHCVSSRCSEKALGFHHCLPAISVKR